jgi:hypothetical protein
MSHKSLSKGQSRNAFKFLTAFFSLLFIISGFAYFTDNTSAAKFNSNNTSNFAYNTLSIPSKDRNASEDGLWQKVDKNAVKNLSAAREIKTGKANLVELNGDLLKAALSGVPLENSAAALVDNKIITLPMPNGSFERFRIVESPMMESGLAAEFPEIKTYSGYSIDNPSSYVRFDTTMFGFHAMVRTTEGLVLIDPYTANDSRNKSDIYVSYLRKDIDNIKRETACLFKGEDVDISDIKDDNNDSRRSISSAPNNTFNLSSGPTLRTYRLAVSTTGEFAQFYGGTVPGAMNGLVTVVNRVNGVYEMELGIRMTLVNNNSQLIFTNPNTDPFTNNNGSTLLGQNQSTVDSIIGSANYDIGHIFSTGGGGIAGLGVVCITGNKARGVTGLPNPIGDAFAIDFVAHEMGHQFGANHTFNGTTSSCGGGNRSSANAYEPGSGTTIMAYAGICGAENLQPNSDPYFHTRSFDAIINFINGTGNCAVQSSTGNSAPLVDAGPDFTIPQGTPFTLTPASASDPNGDPLTYCWEQFNLGAASPPNTDDGTRPIFRSFNPTSSQSRTFPRISDLLNNTTSLGESLPTTSRNMTFRLTVRDNRAGGGGVNNDSMQVSVVSTAGPFLLTQPNSGGTFTGGGSLNVTWNVANTNLSPVNAANVRISLSTDGGNTFPMVLVDSTPNDGSQSVTLPNIQTSTARIKVEAVGNIFFDISNTNFSIQSGTNCTFSISPSSASIPATGGTGSITVTASDSSCASTATSNAAFITVTSGASLTGSGTVTYSVANNTSTTARTGTITVAGQTFTVNQAGAAPGPTCSYTVSPTTASIGLNGGTGSVTVTASDSSCASTAVSNSVFITITGGASLTGNGTVTYSVGPSRAARTGTITVAGQTVTINQTNVPTPTCTFSISPSSTSIAATGGTGSITVTASDSSCARTATSNAAFITVTSGASGTGSGTVTYSVANNTSTSPRTGTITVAGQTFTVNQDGAPAPNCTFSISPTSASFVATGGTGSITVTASNSSCARTATSNAAFITVTSGASGTGSGTVTYSVANNTSTSSRTGTITVAGQTFTVTQDGAPAQNCTFSISPTSASFDRNGGTGTITVTASAGSCASTAVSNSPFITITSGANLTGSGTVTYTVGASKVARTGTITVAGQTFTVNQTGFLGITKNKK